MNERDVLARLVRGPVSGAALARETGQTRAAVWKHINALRAAGLEIAAVRGHGYALQGGAELLERDSILRHLLPADIAALSDLEVAWSLDSTNSQLLGRQPPERGTTVLLAERQTGGRGRRGRAWASPLAASVYLSLSRRFSGGLARLPGLSLVAGVAVAEALIPLGYEQVRLKWPNDVVVPDGPLLRKLGGLLVEGGGEVAGPARAVIGLGLNVALPAAAAATIEQPWTDLATLGGGRPPPRNALVATLLHHLLLAMIEFDARGLAPFLVRYAELDALAGRRIVVHGERGSDEALALGLAPDGALRIRIGDREQLVHAGEVSVRLE